MIPDEFEQAIALNKMRDTHNVRTKTLDNWVNFRDAVIKYYEPLLIKARKVNQLEKQVEQQKTEMLKIQQKSLF